jgi:hypothetical protein
MMEIVLRLFVFLPLGAAWIVIARAAYYYLFQRKMRRLLKSILEGLLSNDFYVTADRGLSALADILIEGTRKGKCMIQGMGGTVVEGFSIIYGRNENSMMLIHGDSVLFVRKRQSLINLLCDRNLKRKVFKGIETLDESAPEYKDSAVLQEKKKKTEKQKHYLKNTA